MPVETEREGGVIAVEAESVNGGIGVEAEWVVEE